MIIFEIVYAVSDEEVLEDGDFEVFGETDWSSDNEPDLVPIRVLTDFSIYCRVTMELVHPLVLANADREPGIYGASGIVKPWSDGSESEDDDDLGSDNAEGAHATSVQRMKTSGILGFDIHHHNFRTWRLDEYVLKR
jgi:DNA (cytosine-5)-methyltransferase 1